MCSVGQFVVFNDVSYRIPVHLDYLALKYELLDILLLLLLVQEYKLVYFVKVRNLLLLHEKELVLYAVQILHYIDSSVN